MILVAESPGSGTISSVSVESLFGSRTVSYNPPRLLNGGLMNDQPTPLGGTCSARFDPLRELFAAKLESGEDLGASLALNIDGEMVVDLWGVWADEARTV